jgi:acetyl-CoA carboxylase biotin carboxyl carrier protein
MTEGNRKSLTVGVARNDDGSLTLTSPGVGVWRLGPSAGSALLSGTNSAGDQAGVGVLSVLGVEHRLVLPAGVAGRVVSRLSPHEREPHVDFGAPLLRLAPLDGAEVVAAAQTDAATDAGGLAFRAPMSGRFYLRPAPDKPAFAEVGATLTRGQTVCLLEVMKTFNRLALSGDDLPERVKVVAVVPADGEDISRGDVLLRLEPA